MSEVNVVVNFPSDLWQRVIARAESKAGIPCIINGEPGTMHYMSPSYLVGVLVKKGLDAIDAREEAQASTEKGP